tara:strand:+ start:8574 stop:9239 length:666 start_codon:yes stop_codon:yes gene_type:complete
MKENIFELIIIETNKEHLKIWEDYFLNKYTVKVLNRITSTLQNRTIFNNETIFISHDVSNGKFFSKLTENNIIFLINDNLPINKSVSPDINSDKNFFLKKPVSLNKIDKIIYDIKTNKSYEKEEKIKIKNYTLIPIQKKLISKDKSEFIKLTEKEVQILTELNNPNFISSKEYLLKKVWNYNPGINTTTVETHIHRLRKKLTKFSETKLAIKYEKKGYYIT